MSLVHSKSFVITSRTMPVDVFDSTDDGLHECWIEPGVYDKPLVFKRGHWRLRILIGSNSCDEGADLQWRGPAILIADKAQVELIGLSIHTRLDSDFTLASSYEWGLEAQRNAGVLCLGQLSLEGCSISTSGGHALALFGSAQLTCHRSRLHHSGRCGLYVDAGHSDLMAQIRCFQSTFEWNGGEHILHHASSSSNEEHETDGVWLTGRLNAYFEACHFQYNRGDGVYAKEGKVTLFACHFVGNEVNGAYAGEDAQLYVQKSTCSESGEGALGVKGGELYASECRLLGGKGVGVFALNGALLFLERSEVSKHQGGGILLISPREGVLLSELYCATNGLLGIVLEYAQGVKLRSLQVKESTQAQLYAVQSVFTAKMLNLCGGQFAFVAEDSSSDCAQVLMSDASDVSLLLKPKEFNEETQVTSINQIHHFEELTIHQTGGVAVLVSGPIRFTLNRSYLIGNPDQLPQELISLDQVKEVCLRRCELIDAEVGLRVRESKIQMVGCKVFGAQETFMILKENSALTARLCIFEDYRKGNQHRIKDLESEKDIPRSRLGAGIWCLDSHINLEKVIIKGQRGSQLILLGASTGFGHHNRIIDGLDAGILIAQGAHLTLTHCRISGQQSAGIWLENQGNLDAQNLEVCAQQSGGIFVRDHSKATLFSCRIHHHLKASVMSDGGSIIYLERCELSYGQDAGLLIENHSEAIVKYSRLIEFKLVGVAVYSDADVELESSEIQGGMIGVLCVKGSKGSILHNWIYGQKKAALLVYKGSKVDVIDNLYLSRDEVINEQH